MDRWNRWVNLSPISEKDLPVLFSWRNSATFRKFCSKRRIEISYENFVTELRNDLRSDRLEQAVIRNRKGILVGTIFSYEYCADDGYLFVSIYLDEAERDFGYGVAAMVVFCSEMFRRYQLFKLYVDVYSHNVSVVAQLEPAGFVQEGRFLRHRREGENRCDMLRFALYRTALSGWIAGDQRKIVRKDKGTVREKLKAQRSFENGAI